VRYMLLLTYDESAQPAEPPGPEVFEAMGRYNTAMVDAGILLAGEGLMPSSQGKLLSFDGEPGDEPTVTDGPFTEAKELVGGFWIIKVDSLDEAVDWARRAPLGGGSHLQVRRVSEASDFEDIAPPGVMEAEEELRRRTAEQHGDG
jgi:hypothetical protein